MDKTLIQGIDVVFIHSNDPDLREWYAHTLGLEPGYGDPHWQEYAMPSGSRFGLDTPGESPSPIEQQAIMISFGVNDIRHAVDLLQNRGVSFLQTPSGIVFDVGPTLVATFQAPGGMYMQLSQRKNPPQITLRTQLHPGDMGKIVHWHGTWYGKTFGWGPEFEPYVAIPLGEFIQRHNPRERIWILEQQGAVKGCIAIVQADDRTAQLRWFYVGESLQGQGWGRKLMRFALNFVKEQGYEEIILWTVTGLDAACHLYKSFGFTLVETHTGSPWGSQVTELKYVCEC